MSVFYETRHIIRKLSVVMLLLLGITAVLPCTDSLVEACSHGDHSHAEVNVSVDTSAHECSEFGSDQATIAEDGPSADHRESDTCGVLCSCSCCGLACLTESIHITFFNDSDNSKHIEVAIELPVRAFPVDQPPRIQTA